MKLTVIYSEFFQVGSHRNSLVQKTVIEVEKPELKNIQEALEKQDIDPCQMNFVFEGECKSV